MELDIEEEHTDEVAQSDSTTSKKRRKTTSQVWEEFDKLGTTEDGRLEVRCKWCFHSYNIVGSHGTKNLLRHLNSCDKREVQEVESSHPKIEQEVYREKVAMAIIRHDYPFSFAEHEGIRDVHTYLNPTVKSISRNSIKSDVLRVYKKEKEKVVQSILSNASRICLTSDLWSSITTDHYMTVTAHFINENWELQKKVLCFSYVPPPYNGAVLAEKLLSLLKEWGIETKIFTITLDNASYNKVMVDILKRHDFLGKHLPYMGDFFHVRCGAHILNLIVQEGLLTTCRTVDKIRQCVKYVRGSHGRKVKFVECIVQCSLSSRFVCQDVPTRWNSTYLMIESVFSLHTAFEHLAVIDSNFLTCPTLEDWNQADRLMKLLKPFYDISTLFCGTKYPTANLYFLSVWKIGLRLAEEEESADEVISEMAKKMKKKYLKYWRCYSVVLSLALILDPRYKLAFIEFSFAKLYGSESKERVIRVRRKLYKLFEEYLQVSNVRTSLFDSSVEIYGFGSQERDDADGFDDFESELFSSVKKSQLDLYLEEPRLDRNKYADLDVLAYWKGSSTRFPVVSLMARDILSIPITTVVSESAFSIGGRILSKYRSSLLPQNAEALLCTRDWLCEMPLEVDDQDGDLLVEDLSDLCGTVLASKQATRIS